jgi:hypothetical protein
MGPTASGGWIRAGSAFAGIGDTIAIGRVLFAGNIPIIPKDECWVPAKENIVHCSIIPISGIYIFIGETSDSARFAESNPARIAIELDTLAEDRSGQDPPSSGSALDLINSRPTQTTPMVNTVENQCRSARASPMSEKLRCHTIHYIGSNAGAAPEGNAGSDEPMEGGRNNDESILDALSPELDDVSPLNS